MPAPEIFAIAGLPCTFSEAIVSGAALLNIPPVIDRLVSAVAAPFRFNAPPLMTTLVSPLAPALFKLSVPPLTLEAADEVAPVMVVVAVPALFRLPDVTEPVILLLLVPEKVMVPVPLIDWPVRAPFWVFSVPSMICVPAEQLTTAVAAVLKVPV